jgi:two-component system NtrC family response regulator
MGKPRILVVDDDESLRRVMQVQLEQEGYAVTCASTGQAALRVLEESSQDLAIVDLKMPGLSGVEFLTRVGGEYPETVVLLITAFATVETAVEAMKLGAYDYLTKPVSGDALRIVVGRALENVRLRQEVQTLRSSLDQKYGFENMIGRSEALLATIDAARVAAQSDATVLIRGETGTGKELLAKGIHFNSRRRDKPFVAINCGAIPKDLLESELFGYRKGAFTGAVAHKKGKVEMCDGGTLLLDEIGDVPFELQVKLLRLIQAREIEKIGGDGPTKVDVRIVAATHRNLMAMVEDGTFRQDLYYRLVVIELELPPLRERAEDIRDLVQRFFVVTKQKHSRPRLVLPDDLIPYFCNYRWPGNVCELENVIEKLVVLTQGETVALNDLPESIRCQRPPLEVIQLELPPKGISLEAVEKELILRALEKSNWNQTQAARYLDISRKTLIYRMEKFGLRKDDGVAAS